MFEIGTDFRSKGRQDDGRNFSNDLCLYVEFFRYKTRNNGNFFIFKAAKAEASGIYSQAAFKKLGFETLASFPYQEFKGKDAEGNNVFAKTGIHKSLDFVARSIPISNCFNLSIE